MCERSNRFFRCYFDATRSEIVRYGNERLTRVELLHLSLLSEICNCWYNWRKEEFIRKCEQGVYGTRLRLWKQRFEIFIKCKRMRNFFVKRIRNVFSFTEVYRTINCLDYRKRKTRAKNWKRSRVLNISNFSLGSLFFRYLLLHVESNRIIGYKRPRATKNTCRVPRRINLFPFRSSFTISSSYEQCPWKSPSFHQETINRAIQSPPILIQLSLQTWSQHRWCTPLRLWPVPW